MRILPGIVGCEAITLVVLLWLAFQGGDVAPPRVQASAVEALSASDAASSTAAMVRYAGAGPNVHAERERADAGPAAAGTIVLQGRLLGIDPPPQSDAVRLNCRRIDAWRSANVREGVYAIAGLSPGLWRVRCEVEGCVRQDFDHVLGKEPVQRLDITLEPAVVLPVFVRCSDGTRLQPHLAKLGVWQGLQVIATEAPLTGDFEPTENVTIGDVGLGRHRVARDLNQRMDPDGDDGVLELDRPPPVNAALLLRHLVLAQQTIGLGQREVRFEVDLAAITARFAKVRLRVVGVDGRPVEGARVSMSTAQGGGSSGRSGEDGEVSVENVLPGLTHVEVWAKDFEQYSGYVTLVAGERSDLGDLVVTRPSTVRGRIVDATGRGAAGTVQWTAIDDWRPPHPMQDRRSTSSDGDGNFELELGARRYVVRAHSAAAGIGFAIFDARVPAAQPFTVEVGKPTEVHVDAEPSFSVHSVLVRNAAGDLLSAVRVEARWREQSLKLPPGEYTLEIHDGRGGFVRRAPLHVGTEPVRVEVP